MNYYVKVITLTDPLGERLPIVTHKVTGIPHVDINQYILRRRRGIVSYNTILKEANVLLIFLSWLESSDIEIGDFGIDDISSGEIHSLWERLRQSSRGGVVSGTVHMYRWIVVQNFIKAIFSKKILKQSVKSDEFKNIVIKKDVLLDEFKSLSYKVRTPRRKGLEKKTVERVLEVSRSESVENPWIKRDRLRNELIIDFLVFLGIRASEVLKIETQDISLVSQSHTVTIKRKEDDPLDPRKMEPRVKTYGRILDLDKSISSKVSEYLKQRRNIKNGKKSKYLFLSHKNGSPLSYEGLKTVVNSIEKSTVDLQGIGLSAHAFRRSWNDRFREASEKLGIDEEMITQSQNYLQGRKLDSQEAYQYASKHIERISRECHMNLQKEYMSGK